VLPPRKHSLRRAILATLGAAALFGPAVFSGCATNFSPVGKIDTLRVLAVTADKPYVDVCRADRTQEPRCDGLTAAACDALCKDAHTVTFNLESYDGSGTGRHVNILWLGGCFDPPDDQYSLCAAPLIELFKAGAPYLQADPEHPKFPTELPIGFNVTQFLVTVPDDIVSRRPAPAFGPYYGIGYVFFLVCAGQFGTVTDDPSAAGTFPIGCFDDQHNPVGADGFVPGYTQLYAFDDGRLNANPEATAISMDGEDLPDAFDAIKVVAPCDVPPQDRNVPPSCSREDPFTACQSYELKVEVPEDVAEEIPPDMNGDDPAAQGPGGPRSETVWVNYYSDVGDFDSDIKLINDPTAGYQDPHEVKWIPPAEPGLATIWAVVRDARGGSTVLVRNIRVELPAK
jgi:hypothetical protein